MPNVIECTSCRRRLSVPEELVGCPVQCPSCGQRFIAPLPNDGATRPERREESLAEQAAAHAGSGELELSRDENVLTAPVRDLPPPPRPLQAVPVDGSPPLRKAGSSSGRVVCPDCGEALPAGATRCPWCSDDGTEDRPWERPDTDWIRRDCEPHRGTLILVFGILSLVTVGLYFLSPIGLGLAIAAWIMGQRDLAKMHQKIMDPQGRGTTQAGWICDIIGTVLNSLLVLGCGGFFILTMFLH